MTDTSEPTITPVIHEGLPTQIPDIDPEETGEWLASFDAMIDERGRERARYLMLQLLARAREKQVGVPALTSTDYINTIASDREPWFPGDEEIETGAQPVAEPANPGAADRCSTAPVGTKSPRTLPPGPP